MNKCFFTSFCNTLSRRVQKASLIHCILTPITLSALFLVASTSNASEVTAKPIKTYVLMGAGERYDSLGQLISNVNQRSQAAFDNCIQKEIYSCVKYTVTGPVPSAHATIVNGEPDWYQLPRDSFNQSKLAPDGPVTSHSGTSGDLGAQVTSSCPPNFSSRITSASGGHNMTCVLPEPQSPSCTSTGNPIDIATGKKFEYEIDYTNADGSIKIERRYIDQYTGWQIAEPDRVIEVLAMQEASYSSPQNLTANSMVLQRHRNVVASDGTVSVEAYKAVYPPILYNPLPQNIVFLWMDGRRYRLIEQSSGTYEGEGSVAQKINLTRVDPSHADGAAWQLVHPNGDISYFSPSGSLLSKQLAEGGIWLYEYNENHLLTKATTNGRELLYEYDEHHRLISITPPDGQPIVYEYGDVEGTVGFWLIHKVTWADGSSVGYHYNEAAHISGTNTQFMLTGKIDALGNRVGTYKYSFGKAVSTEGALGTLKRTLQHYTNFAYVTDGLGTRYTHYFNNTAPDGSRLNTSVNQPAGSGCPASSRSLSYDSAGRKVSETDFNGNKTQFARDGLGREVVRVEGVANTNSGVYTSPASVLPSGARKISTQWREGSNDIIKRAEPNIITNYVYNGDIDPSTNEIAQCSSSSLKLLCHLFQQATTDNTGALGFNAVPDSATSGRHNVYTYNDQGQILTVSRSLTGVPEYTFDYYDTTTADWTQGDQKSISNALGHIVYFNRYDLNGRVLEMTDGNGIESEFIYDLKGRLIRQIVGGAETEYTYDLNGRRIASVLPNGVELTYSYDTAGRLIMISNSLGDTINYEYDAENNLRFERMNNASGSLTYSTENVYDALSRLQNTVNNEGDSSTNLYDPSGNLTGERDGKQQQTNYQYDPLNRRKQTLDPLSGKTEYSYNAAGRITSVTDAKDLTTSYTYNAFGDLVQQTSPDTGTTTFTYDAIGNRTSSTDSRGVVVNYSYDALNRLTSVEYPASSVENVTYSYDDTSNGNHGIGRLTGIYSTGNTTAYHYNHMGLVTAKQTTINNITRAITYVYDPAGQLMEITYPSGRKISYLRDGTGRIVSVSNQENATATEQILVDAVTYLPFGPVASYTYGNGLSLTHSYDLDYRLRAIEVSGINPILDREYQYDPANNITAILNQVDSNKNQTFDYDALHRLTIAEGGYGLLGYTYDAVGNRLSQHLDTGNQLINDTYTYSTASHQLLGISRTIDNQADIIRDFTYDAAGNRVSGTAENGSAQTYSYNQANRMSQASIADVTNGNTAAGYTYNPLGQRIIKTINNQTQEIYHYDEAGQLLAVTDGTGNSLREYIYLDSQQVAFISNGNLYYIHNDHLNTPQIVTDQNQQVVWMADYQPFGKLAGNQNNSVELYSRFPGQYLDEETGLYYNYFRDYDPSLGRYIQSDPIGLGDGPNTYAYVHSNPLRYIDPLGLAGLSSNECLKHVWCITEMFPQVPKASAGKVAAAAAAGLGAGTLKKMCEEGDTKDCEQEWEDAYDFCDQIATTNSFGNGWSVGGRNYQQCVMGQVSERCGGNKK